MLFENPLKIGGGDVARSSYFINRRYGQKMLVYVACRVCKLLRRLLI